MYALQIDFSKRKKIMFYFLKQNKKILKVHENIFKIHHFLKRSDEYDLIFCGLQKTIKWKINKYQLWFVKSYYCLRHIWMIFHKYTLTCKIPTIRIGERENTRNDFIDISLENFARWGAFLLQKYMISIVEYFSLFRSHSQFLEKNFFWNANSRNIHYFNRALNWIMIS